MHFKQLAIVAAIGLVQACGGGGDSPVQTSQIPMQQNKGIAQIPQESQLRFGPRAQAHRFGLAKALLNQFSFLLRDRIALTLGYCLGHCRAPP